MNMSGFVNQGENMIELNITPEFLANIDEILQSCFDNRRYKLNAKYDNYCNCLNIEACGYYIEKYDLESKDIDNPELSDCFYREKNIDFRVIYESTKPDNDTLKISGFWRTELLSYYYTPQKTKWIDFSLKELDTPCSDAQEFESMAPRLCECIQSYFKAEIEAGLFTYKKPDYEDDSETDPEYQLLMNRINDSFFEHKVLELYKEYPHPPFRNTARFLELTTSGKPLTDAEWIEVELLWTDLCQRQGSSVSPLDRQKIIDSWQDE
jgi:hypothetical protein